MPKTKDEILLAPLSLSGLSLEAQAALLTAEYERLVANARSVAFYAIRSAMFGGTGSIAQSERTYLYMWLAEALAGMLVELPPKTKKTGGWTPDVVESEYLSLESKAKRSWEDSGGILHFEDDGS